MDRPLASWKMTAHPQMIMWIGDIDGAISGEMMAR